MLSGWPKVARKLGFLEGYPVRRAPLGQLSGMPDISRRIDLAHPINQGLVGWWPMDEMQGTRIRDLSIYGNHGTLAGAANPPTSTSGWGGGASQRELLFDAIDDLVTVPHSASLNFTAEFSVSCWASIKSTANYPTVVMKGASPYPAPFHVSYESASNYWFFATGNGSNQNSVAYGTAVTLGRIYHLVGVHTGGAGTGATDLFYQNGSFVRSGTTSVAIGNGGTALGIGGRTPGTIYGLNDRVSGVRVWNRALSATEIAQIYADKWIGSIGGIT